MTKYNKHALSVLSVAILATMSAGCGNSSTDSGSTAVSTQTEGQNTVPVNASQAPTTNDLPPKENVTETKTVSEEKTVTVQTDTGVTKPADAKLVSSDADLAFYDNIPAKNLSEVKLENGKTIALVTDGKEGIQYSGLGGAINTTEDIKKTTSQQKIAAKRPAAKPVITTNSINTPEEISKLRESATKYLNKITSGLQTAGANTNVLVNQTNLNSQSTVINIVLDVSFNVDSVTSANVRDIVNKAVNNSNQNLSSSITQTGSKYRLDLSFWLADKTVMFWSGSYLKENEASVQKIYGNLNDASGITSSDKVATEKLKETFQQNKESASKGVDILWSIDASGSMGQEQANLAAGSEQFFKQLNAAGVDYRLAVNTQGYNCTALRKLSDGSEFIDSKTKSAENEWRGIARPGTSDSGTETGFYCVDNAKLQNFDRAEAKNIIIFVSDEPENETVRGRYPVSALSGYKRRGFDTYKTKFLNTGSVYFAIAGTGSVVKPTLESNANVTNDENYRCRGQGGSASGGAHFKKLSELSGGSSASICADSADWSVMFDQILQTATGLASSFVLSGVPIKPSAIITVNGIAISRDPTRQNGYDIVSTDGKSSIVFYGNAIPKQGDNIEVNYDRAVTYTGASSNVSNTQGIEKITVEEEKNIIVEKQVEVIKTPARIPIR